MTATPSQKATARSLVAIAGEYAGVTEVGQNNRGANIDKWNLAAGAVVGSPWCASFVYHVLQAAGFKQKIVGAASCNNLVKYGRDHKLIVTEPQAGDVVVFAWDHVAPAFDHVGIVDQVVRTATSPSLGLTHTLLTIEGNTKQLHGRDGVFRRTRTVTPASCVFIRFL
ncbi:TIGR02594, TIGR02594 family protein [uncultured Caudovirales phage]|uniref:TIGR02594, TIGR02594 family protein n=3 Tax=uncultured Caudovirales phage TaxID=2100421 RepID=A0A6J5R0T3_9CAUD|nr:TIGR02594, TIGR02594 family protein [uncultured Caudovirales phage]CAB4189632.1 TIGR02594, TIGR02594 family protein [uncultured Caudovirales phage]